jgi:hypothetical protein
MVEGTYIVVAKPAWHVYRMSRETADTLTLTNGAPVRGVHLLQHRQHRRAAALQVCDAHQHVRIAAQRANIGVIAAAALSPKAGRQAGGHAGGQTGDQQARGRAGRRAGGQAGRQAGDRQAGGFNQK